MTRSFIGTPESTESSCWSTSSAQTSDRGIVVLSSHMKILYMGGRAAELIRCMQEAETGVSIPGVMPTAIEDFCTALLRATSRQAHESHGVSLELQRLTGDARRPLLLRGFALQNRQEREKSHVVLIIEERSGSC